MDWRVRRIVDNLWGPAGSILLHIVIIFALLHFVTFQQRATERKVEVVIREIEPIEELDDIEEELDELEDVPTVVDAVEPPSVSIDVEPPQVDAVGAAGPEVSDLSSLDIMETMSPLSFKGLYASRSSGGRGAALGKYAGGMGKRTEYAVLKALEWLKNHQYPDGSWGPRYRAAMTGLALLTFLAHGETTASPDYGHAIREGLKYLLRCQKDGVFIAGGPRWSSGRMFNEQIRCYEHAIATYALCEAYGLTQIPFLKYAMEDGIQVLIDGQHAGGSWDYGYVLDAEANIDVSLAGWHIQALKAASAAGAENRGLKTTVDAAMRGLKASQVEDEAGMFRYGSRLREEASDMAMTGVAVLSMQLSGHVMDAEARDGIKNLAKMDFRWSKADPEAPAVDKRETGAWPLYAWYYVTQARFHQGGRTWIQWNKQFSPVLCDMQNPDGSWCPAPDSSEARYGPVYCTTLATLMLEVYYRLLPTFQEIEIGGGDTAIVEEEDEIIITFGDEV